MTTRYAIACKAGARALERLVPGNPATEVLTELATKLEMKRTAKPLQSDFATQKEEIARKALETLSSAHSRHEAGLITDREMWVATDAVYDTISGIVDWEIANLVYRARQELKDHAPL